VAKISRRHILKAGGMLGVSVTLPQVRAQTEPQPTPYRFFNSHEAAFVEAAVDRLIPPDATWAGAKGAGVPIYIDRQLIGGYGQGERFYLAGPWKQGTPQQGYQLRLTPAELYRTSLQAIELELLADGRRFHDRSGEEQDAYLKALEAGKRDLAGFSSAIFFETLLANTVEGFFADPAYGGNRDKVGWRMIGFPGAHAAYLGLYTQHGMKFPGEPIGMDELHRHVHPHSDSHGSSHSHAPALTRDR
jgi:gluconate 2-dehydrogenase gamma chain